MKVVYELADRGMQHLAFNLFIYSEEMNGPDKDIDDAATDTEMLDSESVTGANRGPVTRPDGRIVIGRVGAPPQQEATSGQFFFWVPRDVLAERTQIVTCMSRIAGEDYTYAALIEEVHHRSRDRDMAGAVDSADADLGYRSPFASEGYTYCSASILRVEPHVLTPPRDRSDVLLASPSEAAQAYGFDEMGRPMAVGRLRNGGNQYAGLAQIDLDYLLGQNGGHLNVAGMAGAGTKSTLLLDMLKCLLHDARQPGRREPLYIVPIILNVKGEDLMWIDQRNRYFGSNQRRADHEDWAALGIPPEPFADATFYAPGDPSSGAAAIDGNNATRYDWALRDVIEGGLFRFLFASDDISSAMTALVLDIIDQLTTEDGQLNREGPQTWEELLQQVRDQTLLDNNNRVHGTGTWRAVYRRLYEILAEGPGIFPRRARSGQPLRVIRDRTTGPQVIDIHALPPILQRFVVAAIVKQVKEARTGRQAVRGLRYILALDELNRFAPRNSSDDITRLLEEVASELRSQGVILLGAQQLASQVSVKVIENAAIRVLGRSGPGELQDRVWAGWDKAARWQASVLGPDEKLIMQPTFRQPMLVKMPFPAWAMRREDIAAPPREALPEM